MTAVSASSTSWWKRWLIVPLIDQLTQGISVEKLSWTLAAATVFGLFPILGSTTIVCGLVGLIFKLNQPILQVFKTLFYPLHLVTILVFIRFGQSLFGVDPIPFSITQLLERFNEDMMQFIRDFGMAALHGIIAWAIFAPFIALTIKLITTPLLRKLARGITPRRGAIS